MNWDNYEEIGINISKNAIWWCILREKQVILYNFPSIFAAIGPIPSIYKRNMGLSEVNLRQRVIICVFPHFNGNS